jgi:integrase
MLTESRGYGKNPLIKKKGDYMGGSVHYSKRTDRWYISVYWEGKQNRIWRFNDEPFFDKKRAVMVLDHIRAEITNGEFNPKFYFPNAPLSVAEYAQYWLSKIMVEPSTMRDYHSSVYCHIVPFFGNKNIKKLRHDDLADFYKSIKRSEIRRYNIMATLRTMLRWAWRNEDIPKVPPFPVMTQGQFPEIKYYTLDQQEEILKNIPELERSLFAFAMEYGLRNQEVRALQWDSISENEFIIKRVLSENKLRERTKTRTSRNFGLTPYARAILKSLPLTSSTYVFVNSRGLPFTNRNLNRIWDRACEKAGIEKIKLYAAFRHSLGCQLVDEGVEFDKIQSLLGHTKPDMTKRYAKRSTAKLTEVLVDRRAKIIEIKKEEKK